MLALSLTLPPSLLVSASSCLLASAFVVWLCPLFWVLCLLGAPDTVRASYNGAFCLTVRLRLRRPLRGYARAPAAGMSAPAPKPSASSGLNAGCAALRFVAWFPILVCRSFLSSVPPVGGVPLWATSIEGHLYFVIQNSF